MFVNNLHPIISSFIYGNDQIVAAGSRVLVLELVPGTELEMQTSCVPALSIKLSIVPNKNLFLILPNIF